MSASYWLILFVILLVLEAITLGLTTIWFAGGALVAFILAMLHVPPVVQWAVFCAVSVILLFATRPWAVRYLNGNRTQTNVDSLIGKTALVTKSIRNLTEEGEAVINGLTWTARSAEDAVAIPEGTQVVIKAVSGVKLIVEEKKEE